MIIVEGPDGAGKTTLCVALAKQHGLNIKDWPEARDQMQNIGVKRRVYDSLAVAIRGHASDEVFVHDRLFFSELVYGKVLRGKHAFPRYEFKLVLGTLQALRCPIIFCLPPLDTVVANVEASVQMEGVAEQIEPIYERYFHYRARLRAWPWVMSYDYTGQFPSTKLSRIHEKVDKYLDTREGRKWGT